MRQNILTILLFIITFLLANQRGEMFLVHVSRQEITLLTMAICILKAFHLEIRCFFNL